MPNMQNPSRLWADWTTTDFQALARDRAIAVLPVAATEQHGPHLPLSVDTDLVNGVVQACWPHLPADLPALFLPTQTVGLSPEHARFAGTLTLKAETVIRLWTDIGESVAASGLKKLVLLNAHGGQVRPAGLHHAVDQIGVHRQGQVRPMLLGSGHRQDSDGPVLCQSLKIGGGPVGPKT